MALLTKSDVLCATLTMTPKLLLRSIIVTMTSLCLAPLTVSHSQ